MCDQTNCNVEHNTGTFWILKSCVLKFYLDAIDEADSYLIQINWLLDKQSNTLSNIKSIEWVFFLQIRRCVAFIVNYTFPVWHIHTTQQKICPTINSDTEYNPSNSRSAILIFHNLWQCLKTHGTTATKYAKWEISCWIFAYDSRIAHCHEKHFESNDF